MIWDSFFDDDIAEPEAYSIWKKPTAEEAKAAIPASDVIFEGILSKLDKKSGGLQENYFILTKDRLYYKKVGFDHRRARKAVSSSDIWSASG